MPEFKEVFEEYGADYSSTMARFLGNEGMYLRFLDMLFQDETMQQLGSALDSEEYDAAFAAAHTLKGVVGNMGLTPFYNAVCAIVEPLRAGEKRSDFAALYQNICGEYQKAAELREKLRGGE